MFPPVKISSGGLEIREFAPQDTAQVTAILAAQDRSVLPPGSPSDLAEVPGWLAEAVHERRLSGEGVHLAVLDETDGEIIGSAGLRSTYWPGGRTEIGYGIRESRRGRGHATETARAVARWALTEGGMRRIQLRCRLDNTASLRVAEKAGYQREGVMRLADWDGEQAQDLALFSMIAADLADPGRG